MTTRAIKSPYTAENVAKYVIYLASQAFVGDNKEREGITNLKLQKSALLCAGILSIKNR